MRFLVRPRCEGVRGLLQLLPMNNKPEIGVIGAGSWGTAVANLFADAGAAVTLWGRDASVLKSIRSEHRNKKYLPKYDLNPALDAGSDLEEILKKSQYVVSAIPTQHIRGVFSPVAPLLEKKVLINTAKGIEIGSSQRVSEIFTAICPSALYTVLSGPSFAEEVVARLPAAVTLASKHVELSQELQTLLSNSYFRVYTSTDVVGVEIAGALKNVVAIAAGIVNGLKLGYNAQAAVINRGMAEIMRLSKAFGADPMTFLGLSGMGDLILTCTGPLSRNRRLGLALGEGRNMAEAQKELGGVAEGYFTARSALELARKVNVEMPITEQVYKILYEDQSPAAAIRLLMGRDLKTEW